MQKKSSSEGFLRRTLLLVQGNLVNQSRMNVTKVSIATTQAPMLNIQVNTFYNLSHSVYISAMPDIYCSETFLGKR